MINALVQLFARNPLARAPELHWTSSLLLLFSLILLYFLATRQKGDRLARFALILVLLGLYGFLVFLDFSWQASLPFYHCRIAMILMLCLPDQTPLKTFMAYLGVLGPIIAFAYPVLYAYPFFHITNLSFILSHQLLFYLACHYLIWQRRLDPLSFTRIFGYSFLLTAAMLFSALLTKGNYGFLLELPLLHTHAPLFNFLFLSVLLGVGLSFMQILFLEKRKRGGTP
ncbi:YwaF family protein [Streptococcus sp. NLN64]|uniref:TMEM164 family acyltransferase n=1 Tax=Streptococcus sp. NLN64 TaxID=2822799 RepID=UPI0018C98A8C|nr:YwaF family protein [Streptococcus sp. NLN64]MBG9366803.1 YwaF family protein [Streptococcus sp. NLN64]